MCSPHPSRGRSSPSRAGESPIEPLLQCTDPELFHPRGIAAHRRDRLRRQQPQRDPPGCRRARACAGIPVKVYGGDWEAFIPAASVVAERVPNEEVSPLYEGASVVLNDHWRDMRRDGFMSNRLFDVVAAGGRVLSDDVDGVSELFDGAAATYSSSTDLVAKLRGFVDALFAADEELVAVGAASSRASVRRAGAAIARGRAGSARIRRRGSRPDDADHPCARSRAEGACPFGCGLGAVLTRSRSPFRAGCSQRRSCSCARRGACCTPQLLAPDESAHLSTSGAGARRGSAGPIPVTPRSRHPSKRSPPRCASRMTRAARSPSSPNSTLERANARTR